MTENTGNEENSGNEGDDFVPPKDGSWLPKKRVDEMVGIAKDAAKIAQEALEATRAENARLNAQLSSQNQPPATKQYSREELAIAVERNEISQLQADTLWDKQLRQQFDSELDKRFESFATSTSVNNVVQNDLNAYINAVPDIAVKGSDNRSKVEKEFSYLVSIGEPADSNKTELLAIRNVFGPIDSLKTSLDTLKMETHKETGGSNNSGGEGSKGTFVDTLTARQRAHYEPLVAQGTYKSWDEVKEELSYAKKAKA